MSTTIYPLRQFSPSQFTDLKELMQALTQSFTLTEDILTQILSDPSSTLYICTLPSGKIIGSLTLSRYTAPSGPKAMIEDFVISPEYQGQGIGRKLLIHVISELKESAPTTLCLTSKPSRVRANKLYQALGFQLKETNAYTMKLQ